MKRRSFLARFSALIAALPFVGDELLPEKRRERYEGKVYDSRVPEAEQTVEVTGTDERGEERVETYTLNTVANLEAGEPIASGDVVTVADDGRVVRLRHLTSQIPLEEWPNPIGRAVGYAPHTGDDVAVSLYSRP